MHNMFGECYKIEEIDLTGWNTKNVRDFAYMFSNCSNLALIKVGSGWSTSKATTTNNMFTGCKINDVTKI